MRHQKNCTTTLRRRISCEPLLWSDTRTLLPRWHAARSTFMKNGTGPNYDTAHTDYIADWTHFLSLALSLCGSVVAKNVGLCLLLADPSRTYTRKQWNSKNKRDRHPDTHKMKKGFSFLSFFSLSLFHYLIRYWTAELSRLCCECSRQRKKESRPHSASHDLSHAMFWQGQNNETRGKTNPFHLSSCSAVASLAMWHAEMPNCGIFWMFLAAEGVNAIYGTDLTWSEEL